MGIAVDPVEIMTTDAPEEGAAVVDPAQDMEIIDHIAHATVCLHRTKSMEELVPAFKNYI